MTQRPHLAQETAAQHRSLSEAIIRGDGESVSRIAEEHIEATRRMIIEALLVDTRFREIPIS